MVISKEDSNGRINIGAGNMAFFAVGSGDPCFSFSYTVTFKKQVDPEIYLQALKKALARFWNYRLRPMVEGEMGSAKLYFVNNTEEPKVFYDEGQRFDLGTDQTAHYLFVALYKENTITIRAFHGIVDGRGGLEFIKAVTYHYLALSEGTEIEHGDVLTDEIPEDESERVCEYETYGDKDAEPFYMPDLNDIYVADEDRTPMSEGRTVRYNIRCDLKTLLGKAKQAKVTVTPWLNTILGRAIYEVYDVGEQKVVGTCPVDGRALYNVHSLTAFGTTIKLLYDKRFNDLDFVTAVKMERALMELQLTKANFEKEYYETMQSTNLLVDQAPSPVMFAVPQFMELLNSAHAKSTYTITNIGTLTFNKDMQSYVEGIHVSTVCRTPEIVFAITSCGDDLNILVSQFFERSALADKVAELLIEQGVDAEVTHLEDYYTDRLMYNF